MVCIFRLPLNIPTPSPALAPLLGDTRELGGNLGAPLCLEGNLGVEGHLFHNLTEKGPPSPITGRLKYTELSFMSITNSPGPLLAPMIRGNDPDLSQNDILEG